MPNINIELSEEDFQFAKKRKGENRSWKSYLFRNYMIDLVLNNKPMKVYGMKTEDYDPAPRIKPCHKSDICPYGFLTLEFPKTDDPDILCTVSEMGCPIFYTALTPTEYQLKIVKEDPRTEEEFIEYILNKRPSWLTDGMQKIFKETLEEIKQEKP